MTLWAIGIGLLFFFGAIVALTIILSLCNSEPKPFEASVDLPPTEARIASANANTCSLQNSFPMRAVQKHCSNTAETSAQLPFPQCCDGAETKGLASEANKPLMRKPTGDEGPTAAKGKGNGNTFTRRAFVALASDIPPRWKA